MSGTGSSPDHAIVSAALAVSLIAAILAFIFLDAPWRYVLAGLLLLTDVVEVYLWLKWRKTKSITGAEAMVGARGVALTECDPEGQVKVKGQIWRAHSSPSAKPNDPIEVVAVDGISLRITPI